MNPFLLSPTERLASWRAFRTTLGKMDEMEQLHAVASWVNLAPASKFVLDYDQADTWPTPWDLLNEGDFDDVAMAYLMEQTLIMAGWDESRLSLHMVRNSKDCEQMMILLIDDKWALNYSHSDVINFDIHRENCAYLVSYRVNPEGGHTEF